MQPSKEDLKIGVISGLLAYTMWGFFPLYFKEMQAVSPVEMLAHRIIWAIPFGLAILYFRKQISEVISAITNTKTFLTLILAAVIIAINWGFYVWAVQTERIFQASLGYYINPLVFILVGVFISKETLSPLQMVAVGLATLGVLVLTFAGGTFPWLSFVLAISFTAYGYIRKIVPVGAMPGLFIETLILLIPAILYWVYISNTGQSAFFNLGGSMPLWIIFSGPLTVLPLLFFALAARRLRLSTVGFMQFIGPTLQFFIGFYYGESFTMAHAVCFGAIWLAVGTYLVDAIQKSRKAA